MTPRLAAVAATFFAMLLLWPAQCPAQAALTLENGSLRVELDGATGRFTVLDKKADARWVPFGGEVPCEAPSRTDAPQPALKFRAALPTGAAKKLDAAVSITLAKDAPEVRVEIAADNGAEIKWASWPPPLVPEKGDAWLATTPYCGGLLLKLRQNEMPGHWSGLELPFFGVSVLPGGWGYACIYETPDDLWLTRRPTSKDKDARVAVGVAWTPCKGKWGYTRRLLYRFSPSGGYVAAAKAYRAYAQGNGTLRTLREKMKRRPDLAKLLGAPDVWGGKGLAFCREAKAAGIDRLLVNGSWGTADTEAIKKLGYLVSCYDNYEDMMPGKGGHVGDCKVPDDQVLMADGKRMAAWPVHVKDPKTGRTKIDPKTGRPVVKEQFSKRCSVLYPKVARKWIPLDQAKNPRNARFIDVTTARGLRECYDPNHPCTREQDRKVRCELAKYVSQELGLVLGGEHGQWWGVPDYDYWEGIQSGGFYSWPAGHVGMDLPRKREEIGKEYLTYGIGHYCRIPLWELVFGDCTVSYWYWGDSTGHLFDVAPEISYKKDLFNMLYGTLPLYWVDRPFGLNWSKPNLRARLLESYRTVCKLHEHTGLLELTNHEWLTEDRTVQKSTFADGTFVVVNFSEKNTYKLEDQGKTRELAPLGFYARGPGVLQYRLRAGEGKTQRDVTFVHTGDYWFADGGGEIHDSGPIRAALPTTVRVPDTDRLLVHSEWPTPEPGAQEELHPLPKKPAVTLIAARFSPTWHIDTTKILRLDDSGERSAQVGPKDALFGISYYELTNGELRVSYPGHYEVVYGKAAKFPNLCFVRGSTEGTFVDPFAARQGETVTIPLVVENGGGLRADDVQVDLFLGSTRPADRVSRWTVSLEAGETKTIEAKLDTRNLDGDRMIYVLLDPANRIQELVERDNDKPLGVTIALDPTRWPGRASVEVRASRADQENVPVALPVDFGPLLKKAGLEGPLDAGSIRVCDLTHEGGPGKTTKCQFSPAPGFDAKDRSKGTVYWVFPGRLGARESRRFVMLFDVASHGPKRPLEPAVWDASSALASAHTYETRLTDGCISDLGIRFVEPILPQVQGSRGPVFSGLVYSSAQTGWVQEEDGKVLSQEVLDNGPVRAVLRVRKQLKGGVVYEKTYTFWPDRIDVEIEANKDLGVLSRAYYAMGGHYEDSAGNKAKIDGAGDGEGVIGQCPSPKWYAVYSDRWAHSCVALTEFSNITYWDAGGNMGGVGFHGSKAKVARLSYVFHEGQRDASFAKADYERLTNPPTARLVP